MHTAVLLIGDTDPATLIGQETPLGTIDWAATGGRFTGQLTPLPGRTGRVSGDALPRWEAQLAAMSPGLRRAGPPWGAGVDQLAAADLDLDSPGIGGCTLYLAPDGVLHDPGTTPEETGTALAANMIEISMREMGPDAVARQLAERGAEPVDLAVLDEADRKFEAFGARLRDELRRAPAGTQVTIVDVHACSS